MSIDTSRVCMHGALRRQCEACQLADDLEAMTAERDQLRAEVERLKQRADEDDARWTEVSVNLVARAEQAEARVRELQAQMEDVIRCAELRANMVREREAQS